MSAHLRRAERENLYSLMAAISTIQSLPGLQKRIARIPNGAEDWKTVNTILMRVYSDLIQGIREDVADSEFAAIRENVKHVGYTVFIKNTPVIGSAPANGRYLSVGQLETVFNALQDHCLVCALEPVEQRSCSLAKVLDTLPIRTADPDKEERKGCAYAAGW